MPVTAGGFTAPTVTLGPTDAAFCADLTGALFATLPPVFLVAFAVSPPAFFPTFAVSPPAFLVALAVSPPAFLVVFAALPPAFLVAFAALPPPFFSVSTGLDTLGGCLGGCAQLGGLKFGPTAKAGLELTGRNDTVATKTAVRSLAKWWGMLSSSCAV